MERYDAPSVEAKWQKRWANAKAYEADFRKAKNPYYSLVMFPYPSGDKLHVGHWYNFAPADSYARYMRMQGKDVFSPMGFDAFGLPAENYAIKTGIHPPKSIAENTATMTKQLKRIGTMYDWSKTLNTSQPEYYRWTQWVFLQMFKNGLAYRKEANVNWCPKDQTVLANEQAQNGVCDRCGTPVVQKPVTQWFWRITDYSQRLLDNLDKLDWPEKTKLMQRNWIGRSEGCEVTFDIEGKSEKVTVFTTRVDTLPSGTFIVLAPEHPLVDSLTTEEQKSSVKAYQMETAKKTDLQRTDLAKEKTGAFTGSYALNPLTGARMPIWIADFVLAHYGFGAVFADAHDDRDFEFAKKYSIPLKTNIRPADGSEDSEIRNLKRCFTEEGILYDSGEFDGLTSAEARPRIAEHLEKKGKGRPVVTYRLRDWSISRQRYWGAPIPIVYDPKGVPHPISEKHLPWLLPTDVEFKPTGTSPLAQSKELKERTEKIFGKGWTPEVDTMDTFVCSSFYQFRYLAEGSEKEFVPKDVEIKWMPVDMYIGGPEHACMHLIYARFVTMALHDFGYVKAEEPFKKLVHQGLITNGGAKMSKSKGNVVSPDEFINQVGSDVFRMYLMFMGPFTEGGDWSDTGIKGIERFVQRIWKLTEPLTEGKKPNNKGEQSLAATAKLHATIKKVTEDIERLRFNTALSALMELLNELEKESAVSTETIQLLSKLLSPLAPHLAEELWDRTGGEGFVIDQPWPTYDAAKLVTDTITVVVQINGKLRAQLTLPADVAEADAISQAKADENVVRFLAGKPVKKAIYVPGKLVNLVV